MSCQYINIDVKRTELTCLELRTKDSCVIRQPQRVKKLEIVSGGPVVLLPIPGTTSYVTGEVPSGLINSSNTIFTTLYDFAQIAVYYQTQRMKEGVDYNITDTNEITFTFAPETGFWILVDYVVAL